MTSHQSIRLEILHTVPGRALLAERDGSLYIGRGYEIFRSNDQGANWERVTALPRSLMRRFAEPIRLARRLLRHEIRALAKLSDGTYIAATREGVFYGHQGDSTMCSATFSGCERQPAPPMRIEVGPNDTVVWGEYSSKRSNELVGIFASGSQGRSYELVHSFPPSSVRHIHNIRYDANRDHYWIMTGDYGDEPGVGILSSDFSRFDWLVRGEQRYRTTHLFDLGNSLILATDTEIEPNRFVSLDKSTGAAEEFGSLPGSCLYASRFGQYYVLSTSVEPSRVNPFEWATMWISRDGRHWSECFRARKDRWHPRYFQYGSIVLPNGTTGPNTAIFSGQALRGLDGITIVALLQNRQN